MKRSRVAAPRTRRSPAHAFPQLCIWDAASCPVFSLVGRLPSMSSAGVKLPPLFGHFVGTTQTSDSLPAFLCRVGRRRGPAANADVSFALPKIPDSEFSSVRFKGRFIRRCLPTENVKRFASVLHAHCFPHYALAQCQGVQGTCASPFKRLLAALPQGSSLRAGYAVPPFLAYSTPCAPLASTFRLHLIS